MERDIAFSLAASFAAMVEEMEEVPGVWVPADAELKVYYSYDPAHFDGENPEAVYTISRDAEYVHVNSFGAWPLLEVGPNGEGV